MDLDSMLVELANMIETYEAMGDPAAAALYWNSTVVPLLASISTVAGVGGKVAVEFVYRQLGFAFANVVTDGELAALGGLLARREAGVFVKKMLVRAAAAGVGPQDAVPFLPVLLVGAAVLSTATEANASVNTLKRLPQYKQYIRQYLNYVVKNHIIRGDFRLPPPATFEQYAQSDLSGAWWQI